MAVRYEDIGTGFGPVRSYQFETGRLRAGVGDRRAGDRRARARAAEASRRRLARRRLSTAAVLLAVVVVILMGGGSSIASKPGAPDSVVLQQGDTLWGVATRFAPTGIDKRAYVDALYELNGIAGAPAAGQKIALPGPHQG